MTSSPLAETQVGTGRHPQLAAAIRLAMLLRLEAL
jgi:hypothetical protein